MHELPNDLTHSLRSFRGSIYGSRRSNNQHEDADVADIEKGPEDYGDKQFERALTRTNSSIVLHPTKSRQKMDQQRDWYGRQYDLEKQDQRPDWRSDQAQHRQHDQHNSHQQHDQQHDQHGQQQQRGHGQQQQQQQHGDNESAAGANDASTIVTKDSLLGGPPVMDPDPAAARLAQDLRPLSDAEFYELIGINPPDGQKNVMIRKLATRDGLYAHIYRDFKHTEKKYRMFDIGAYVLLVVQLIISAVFIILGSLEHVNTHITIAVLGAVATVIAGGLALMKGQGLPNRLRQERDGYKTILFEADELYWDVRSKRTVLYKDIRKLREDYLRVGEAANRSHPDTWNGAAGDIAQGVSGRGGKKK